MGMEIGIKKADADADVDVEEEEKEEHRGIGDCAFYCNPCNQTFRFEVDLKTHTEKHCTKCGEEFSPANILKAHKLTCK